MELHSKSPKGETDGFVRSVHTDTSLKDSAFADLNYVEPLRSVCTCMLTLPYLIYFYTSMFAHAWWSHTKGEEATLPRILQLDGPIERQKS